VRTSNQFKHDGRDDPGAGRDVNSGPQNRNYSHKQSEPCCKPCCGEGSVANRESKGPNQKLRTQQREEGQDDNTMNGTVTEVIA
jgi:hypothetical protein